MWRELCGVCPRDGRHFQGPAFHLRARLNLCDGACFRIAQEVLRCYLEVLCQEKVRKNTRAQRLEHGNGFESCSKSRPLDPKLSL